MLKIDPRYIVLDTGQVISTYRYRHSHKVYEEHIQSIYLHNGSPAVSLILEGKQKTYALRTLMCEVYHINPPDRHHQYDCISINDDPYDCSIGNIGWRLRCYTPHQPIIHYNSNGDITDKTCGVCCIKKDIKHYQPQKPRKGARNLTYRNDCNACRSKYNWAKVCSNPVRLAKQYEQQKLYRDSPYGKQVLKAKQKQYVKAESPGYIAHILKIPVKDLTPELLTLKLKYRCLKRQLMSQTL